MKVGQKVRGHLFKYMFKQKIKMGGGGEVRPDMGSWQGMMRFGTGWYVQVVCMFLRNPTSAPHPFSKVKKKKKKNMEN